MAGSSTGWGRGNQYTFSPATIPTRCSLLFYLRDAPLPHDDGLVLAQVSHRLRVQVQVSLHQLGWCQRHPLVQRHVDEAGGSEHLQVAQRLLAPVLDVVRHREWHVAHVACLVVEGPRLLTRGEHGHTPTPRDVI